MRESFVKLNNQRWKALNIFTLIAVVLLGIFIGVNYFEIREGVNLKKGADFDIAAKIAQIKQKLTPEQQLIVFGDESQKTAELKQKAISDKFPKNKVYYANYVNNLKYESILNVIDDKDLTAEDRARIKQENSRFIKVLNKGEELDPQNALYNYYKAYVYFSEAVRFKDGKWKKRSESFDHAKFSEEQEQQRRAGIFPKFIRPESTSIKVIDENKLKLGLVEYFKALKKPYLKTYASDLAVERTKLCFNKIDSVSDSVGMDYFRGFTFSHFSIKIKSIAKVLVFDAQKEYQKGNIAETKRLLNSWQPLITQYNAQSDTLMDIFTSSAVLSMFIGFNCEFYNEINDKVKLKGLMEKRLGRYNIIPSVYRINIEEIIQHQAGFYAKDMIGFFKKFNYYGTEKELIKKLSPERMMWYKVFEKQLISIYALIILMIVIILWIIALCIKKKLVNDDQSIWYEKNIIIKPSKRHLITLVLCGIILPLGIFLTLTNIESLSGRQSLFHNFPAGTIQWLLLFVLIVTPAFYAVSLIVRSFCKKHEIVAPLIHSFVALNYWFFIVILLLLSTQLLYPVYDKVHCHETPIKFVMIFVCASTAIGIVGFLGYMIVGKIKKDPYKRMLFINVVPYFAVLTFIMIVSFYSIFSYQERQYFLADEFIFSKNLEYPFTELERQNVEYSKKVITEKLLND